MFYADNILNLPLFKPSRRIVITGDDNAPPLFQLEKDQFLP